MTQTINLDQLIQSSQKGFRVDVVGLAKKLGLEVYSVDLPESESGHIRQQDGEAFIEVNRNHPVTRQRFTVAHEIGHYVKHNPVLVQKGQLDRKNQYASEAEIAMEAEADKTAAEILMPAPLVNAYLDSKKITQFTKFDTAIIGDIAHEFRVSRAMVVTRLRTLGIPVPFLSFA